MDEIAPGLIDYSAFHRGIGMTVHSHYLALSGVLIDPMPVDGALPREMLDDVAQLQNGTH